MNLFSCAFISSLAIVASASPVPGTVSYSVNDRDITVTNSEIKTLGFFAQYAAAGNCNSKAAIGSTVACSNNACPEVTAAGATIVSTFSGMLTDVQGFVSVDDTNELIVTSFKGSSSVRNWITDFVFIQVPCDLVDGCLLHAGFATAWKEIADAVAAGVEAARAARPSYRIVFTGHSLGGAVATIAAGYLRGGGGGRGGHDVDLYTYGSPRPGNGAFVERVSARAAGLAYRVTHAADPVPRLPPLLLNYRHTSPEYWFRAADNANNASDFTAADVKVCEGSAAIGCNGGVLGLNSAAHNYYFQDIVACSPNGTEFRRGERAEVNVTYDMATTEPKDLTDEELEAKLNDLFAQDIEYVATLDE